MVKVTDRKEKPSMRMQTTVLVHIIHQTNYVSGKNSASTVTKYNYKSMLLNHVMKVILYICTWKGNKI